MNPESPRPFPFANGEVGTDEEFKEVQKRWYAYPYLIEFVSACRRAEPEGVEILKIEANDLYRKYR